MNKKSFYITTPLYYPSGLLHIGHAYSTVYADVINRYKKFDDYDTYFLVGADEHGQKIAQKAKAASKTPIEFVNGNVEKFILLWKDLNIKYDFFIRTTSLKHQKTVKQIFSNLLEKKLVYKDYYSGLYCKTCEEFLTPLQVKDGKCLVSLDPIEEIKEETIFLKTSQFGDFLLDYYKKNPNFIFPKSREKEMVNNFIKPGLTDLSITRVSFDWGIKLDQYPKHVFYVWLDALSGYLSGIKYQEDPKFFKKYWNKNSEIVQIIGKEITRFHTIYWPIILKTQNLRFPNKIISHGWITFNKNKMSKSLGNVINPYDLIKQYGCDALRYFLVSEFKIENDSNYTPLIMKKNYNNNLVNNYGNLVSRLTNMVLKYFDGKISNDEKFVSKLIDIKSFITQYKNLMDKYDVYKTNELIMKLLDSANKYIEDNKPWTLWNKNNDQLKFLLSDISYVIIISSFLLKPIIPIKTKEVLNVFHIKNIDKIKLSQLVNLDFVKNINIKEKIILFKRI